jgi:hypothetical protein
MSKIRFTAGDVIVCSSKERPNMRLTTGRRYLVIRVSPLNFPTIENDAGQHTQYSDRHFAKEAGNG